MEIEIHWEQLQEERYQQFQQYISWKLDQIVQMPDKPYGEHMNFEEWRIINSEPLQKTFPTIKRRKCKK